MMPASLALLLAVTLTPPPAADTGLVVRVVRFYRAEVGQTQVAAFIQAPRALGQGLMLRVADSAGTTLWEQSWLRRDDLAVSTVDHLRFTIGRGRYVLEVTLRDSSGTITAAGRTPVTGFDDNPGASDLLLAPKIRGAEPRDSVPEAGEFRRGNLLISSTSEVRLTAATPVLHYLLEAYAPEGGEAVLAAMVVDREGATLRVTAPAPIEVPQGVGILSGQLDVATLPPGQYHLVAILTLGEQRVQRTAPFWVDGPAPPVATTAAGAGDDASDLAYFAALSPAELAAALAPLAILPSGRLLDPRSAPRDPEALRQFLAAFWRSRDPDPDRPGNPAREMFYRSVRYADEWYREPGRPDIPGWRTDRGRVLLRNGGPSSQVLRRAARGGIPAYEAWRYQEGAGFFYLFADRAGLGSFELVLSDDLRETGRRDWRAILTPRAVAEVEAFLGERLP